MDNEINIAFTRLGSFTIQPTWFDILRLSWNYSELLKFRISHNLANIITFLQFQLTIKAEYVRPRIQPTFDTAQQSKTLKFHIEFTSDRLTSNVVNEQSLSWANLEVFNYALRIVKSARRKSVSTTKMVISCVTL